MINKASKDYKRVRFCVVTINDEHTKRFKTKGLNLKIEICAEFCLNLIIL